MLTEDTAILLVANLKTTLQIGRHRIPSKESDVSAMTVGYAGRNPDLLFRQQIIDTQ